MSVLTIVRASSSVGTRSAIATAAPASSVAMFCRCRLSPAVIKGSITATVGGISVARSTIIFAHEPACLSKRSVSLAISAAVSESLL